MLSFDAADEDLAAFKREMETKLSENQSGGFTSRVATISVCVSDVLGGRSRASTAPPQPPAGASTPVLQMGSLLYTDQGVAVRAALFKFACDLTHPQNNPDKVRGASGAR